MTDFDFAPLMLPVATLVWGQPNRGTEAKNDVRWGSKSSRSVDVAKGVWFDNETQEGGGVKHLLAREQGCTTIEEVFGWLESKGLKDREDRPMANGHAHDQQWPVPIKIYDYVDENRRLLYQVCRYPDGTPGGRFKQRKPDGKGGWNWKIKGIHMVPYRYPELIEAVRNQDLIFITEGEKDADNLLDLGVPATTNAAGAQNFYDEMAIALAGADVVIMEDNDEAGRARTAIVGAKLRKLAKRVRVLRIPGLGEKGDVTDWLESGPNNDAEALYQLVAKHAELWLPSDLVSAFGAIHWRDLDQPGPEHEWLIKDLLTRGERSMLYGPSQSGKSFAAFDISMCVALGRPYFGRKARRGGVVYFAIESGTGFKNRMRAYREAQAMSKDQDVDFVLLTKRTNLYADPAATDALIAEIKMHAALMSYPLELVVLDTWSAATAGADEIRGKDVSIIMERVNRIMVECKCHVMIVHHMNASGERPRGHTSMFADIENSISVVKSNEDKDEDGRAIRTAVLEKQKEGEDGDTWTFVLRPVVVSVDEDGNPVTSCVVQAPAGEGKAPAAHAADQGIGLTPNDAVAFQALLDATGEMGTDPPGSLELPKSANIKVVRHEHWLLYYARISFEDGGPIKDGETEEQFAARRREANYKALQRAGPRLLQYGLIGKHGNHVWWTGKAVKGFRITQPAKHFDDRQNVIPFRTESASMADALPDDVDNLF